MKNNKPQSKDQHKRRRVSLQINFGKPLTEAEAQVSFRGDVQFPPLLSLDQAAQLAHFAPSTIKRLASEGHFRNSVRRGKPMVFWRDRFVVEVMELDKARKRIKNSKAQKNRKEVCRNETN